MALKFVLENLDSLDDAQKGLYSKHTDGKYYLEVEGAVAKSKVDEFRENNIALKQQIEDLTNKYGQIDLEKYKELVDKAALDDGKKRITVEKVDEIVTERTKKMREDYENQLNSLKDVNGKLGTQLNGLLIDSAVRSAAQSSGVRSAAMEDVVLRANTTFKVVDGKAVAHDSEGRVVYGKDGSSPLTTTEWIQGLRTSAPHLFEQSQGGGASGGDSRRGSSGGPDRSNMSPLQKIAAGMSEKA